MLVNLVLNSIVKNTTFTTINIPLKTEDCNTNHKFKKDYILVWNFSVKNGTYIV